MADPSPEQTATAVLTKPKVVTAEDKGTVINEINTDHPLWDVPTDDPKDPIVVTNPTIHLPPHSDTAVSKVTKLGRD